MVTLKYKSTQDECLHKSIDYIVCDNGYGCVGCGAFVLASEMAGYKNHLTSTKILFTTIVHDKFMQKTKEVSDPESWLKPKYENKFITKKKKKIAQIKAKKKAKIVPGSMAFHAASPVIITELIIRLKSKAWAKVDALGLLGIEEQTLVTRIVDLQLGMIEHLGMSVNQVTNPKSMALAQESSGVSDKILTLISNAVKANKNKGKMIKFKKPLLWPPNIKPMIDLSKDKEPCHYDDYTVTVDCNGQTIEETIKLTTITVESGAIVVYGGKHKHD